jgi:hypothetical protein
LLRLSQDDDEITEPGPIIIEPTFQRPPPRKNTTVAISELLSDMVQVGADMDER